ncbi:type II toxin-antitoxin system VapC family toxin [Cylindrospermum sp. FACHB-282]|uniref:type II toxin-antitoxin system VapC family toxin n=1 Tax=Cylindrospermum sp. FACHB-282 TaxID=2692794 RepID=UPI001689F03E|nr:PIN domain-containing protein [Cylindrospermum sp. FACHB-282]MBD2388220.1 PIN domain-containing protein [Cylindrospermum sp. FACHB-282]
MTVILDTSFLFALADQSDRNHERVLAVAQTISEPLLLPSVVLPEVCYLISSRLGHQAMRRFLANLAISGTQLEQITTIDLERVNEILEQYADSQLDFVDAVIVTIAERLGITCVLTLDRRDFSLVRPKHCDYFKILP